MHEITEQYQKEIEKYNSCCQKIEILINELLTLEKVKFHKIEARAKSADSLDRKIYSKNEKYNSLDEVTDIVAFRIITYFEDEVDTISEIIKKEFQIDEPNSCDKRVLPTNTFGYRSLHYVVTLNKGRKNLKEYTLFKDIKIEIQIRSILQHAWAEIEHDMGYKGIDSVPDSFKRNFSMIAALLEMADRDFVNLRKESDSYKEQINEKIQNNPENVNIDLTSLTLFIRKNKVMKEIIDNITRKRDITRIKESTPDSISTWLEGLEYLKIKTISELNLKLGENKNMISIFAEKFITPGGSNLMYDGWPIIYLIYILISQEEEDKQYYFFNDIQNAPHLKDQVNEIYKTEITNLL